MRPIVRLPRPGDIEELAETMRPEDAAEVLASDGKTPFEALKASVAASDQCYTGLVPEGILCMFGTSPTDRPGVGCVWLLGSRLVEKHAKSFVRLSRTWMDIFNDTYPVLFNLVDSRHTKALRWLKRLGAEFHWTGPHGPEGREFQFYTRRRKEG